MHEWLISIPRARKAKQTGSESNIIVVITCAAIVGAVALGMALAFGLGGRDVAARLLENTYSKGLEVKDDVRRDVRTGVERHKTAADELATSIAPAPRPKRVPHGRVATERRGVRLTQPALTGRLSLLGLSSIA